jgi:hypothetical protein
MADELASSTIEKGRFYFSLIVVLFLFTEAISFLVGNLNIGRIFIGILMLYLIYEGYDWTRVLFAIFNLTGLVLGIFILWKLLQTNTSFGNILALALILLSSCITFALLIFSKDTLAFLARHKRKP